MACDICGKDGQMFRAIIEGSEMKVCQICAKFGKVLTRFKTPSEVKQQHKIQQRTAIRDATPKPEMISVIIEGYAKLLKEKREKAGLTLEDLGKKLNEKESLLHRIESGAIEPNIAVARKLEKFFGIKLVEEHEEKHQGFVAGRTEEMTLGDFVKVKK